MNEKMNIQTKMFEKKENFHKLPEEIAKSK